MSILAGVGTLLSSWPSGLLPLPLGWFQVLWKRHTEICHQPVRHLFACLQVQDPGLQHHELVIVQQSLSDHDEVEVGGLQSHAEVDVFQYGFPIAALQVSGSLIGPQGCSVAGIQRTPAAETSLPSPLSCRAPPVPLPRSGAPLCGLFFGTKDAARDQVAQEALLLAALPHLQNQDLFQPLVFVQVF